MSTLTTRQTFALIVLFVVTSLAFIQLDNRRALEPIKTSLHEVLVPVARAVDRVTNDPRKESDLEREVAAVRAERDALASDNIKLRAKANQVDQLQKQLKVQEKHPKWTYVTARVINPDPANLQKFITIDKGAKDGIEEGMAVVDPDYYVGQVTNVWEDSARVTLIIDASQVVGARLLDTGADGVIYGVWQQGGRLQLRHLDRDTKIQEGEVVITSDNANSRTAKVPPDIAIGKITGTPTVDRQSDSLTVNVLPVANFDNLQVVTVVLTDEG